MPSNDRRRDGSRATLASAVAAYALSASASDILLERRGDADAAAARHLAMYLAHVAFAMSYGRVANAFGRDRSTVAYATHKVEEWRERPDIDLWIQSLERMLREAPDPRRADLKARG